MVPPTPPVTLSATTSPFSGMVGTRPAASSPRFGRVTIAEPTTVTNMRPTKKAMTFSKNEYLPNHTMTPPSTPAPIANTLRSTPGKSACNGSAVELIAAAP